MRGHARLIASTGLVCCLALACPAWGADESFGEQIEQYSRVLASLESEDEAHAAKTEIGQLRTWLLEARMLVRESRDKDLRRLLKRIGPQIQLARAEMDAQVAQARAEAQEHAADEAETRLRKLKRDKELLDNRLALLQRQRRSRQSTPTSAAPGPPAAAAPPGPEQPAEPLVPSRPEIPAPAPASPEGGK